MQPTGMIRLSIIVLSLMLTTMLSAQENSDNSSVEGIVERINSHEPGKGTVLLIQDMAITERIGKPGTNRITDNSERFVEVNGYRIQVFAGNNQRVSKNEAYNKESEIKSIFPEYSTYVGFTAPFWRLRVGDFQSFQEAQQAISKLRSKFPSYGREMSIVKDKVRIKVD